MRVVVHQDGVSVHAIAGTHVVLFGFNLAAAQRPGCLGFAVQRQALPAGPAEWLKGLKTFAGSAPSAGGQSVSSREQPLQTFVWGDYGARPGQPYRYTVVPLYGTPTALREGPQLVVEVTTEAEAGQPHSIYFNRGAAASQQYALRFGNQPPEAIAGGKAFTWLSRGLLEGLLAFIDRARDATYSLHGAVYELQLPAALAALQSARQRGASLHLVYDAIPGQGHPGPKNAQAIEQAGLADVVIPRTAGTIMHNKFLILSRHGHPVAVWTGSTNLTLNGVFGHSNCGHVVDDPALAGQYLAYWQQLQTNPTLNEQRDWLTQHNPVPPATAPVAALFSPHRGEQLLAWLAALAGTAQTGLFMTFPFGMSKAFQAIYSQPDQVLRFALLDREGNGSGLAAAQASLALIRQRANVVLAVGNYIKASALDRWVAEIDKITQHVNVHWVHTKYLLVDPLGPSPVVVVGSANFSSASTNANDENLLVLRGDQRVADVYLTEFMRLHVHYAFREALAKWANKGKNVAAWQPQFLASDDSWQADYFAVGSARYQRRCYFSR